MNSITFEVLREPVAKARARTVALPNGAIHSYTPKKTVQFEIAVADAARAAFAAANLSEPFDGPLELQVTAVFSRPKSLMKKKDLNGRILHTKRPDLDNIEKGVADGINSSGVWTDDARIAKKISSKFYAAKGELPRVIVKVSEINDDK